MKSWLKDNGTEIYSTHNKEKHVVAERFIRILKQKNVYTDEWIDVTNKYNKTNHRTIKRKPLVVTSSTYIDFEVKNNDKGFKFEAVNHIKISKHKNIFVKGCTGNWLEEMFLIKEIKILCHGHMQYKNLTVKKCLKSFLKKNCKRQIKQILELKK